MCVGYAGGVVLPVLVEMCHSAKLLEGLLGMCLAVQEKAIG